VLPTPAGDVLKNPPLLDELVVVTWNAHLFDGDLPGLVADLRRGRLTGGEPVRHFVVLLQEVVRRGPDVPAFDQDDRSAFAIPSGEARGRGARELATSLGLSMLYVPSMRNGPAVFEDRGNAIVSSEPLHDLFAIELPLERQRRVSVGASIEVQLNNSRKRVALVSTHLEPLSSPALLWVFRSPRARQLTSLLQVLQVERVLEPSSSAGTVLGGDFNTIQAGAAEDAYAIARGWSRSVLSEDPRPTHLLGRLDYLFFRSQPEWTVRTTRVDLRYGSDHHPVLGRITREHTSP
jgi:endonuclease/exonuclease/phosphatase family metal-dependent hydrolase